MGRILERLRIQWNEYFEMYSGTIENSMKLKYFEMNFWKKLRIWWSFSILVRIFGRNWKFDEGLLFWNKILREIRNRKYYWFSRTCWPRGNIHTRGPRDGAESGRRAWSVVAWGTLECKSSMPHRCAATHARTPPLDGLRGLVRFFPSLTMRIGFLESRMRIWARTGSGGCHMQHACTHPMLQ